MAESEPSQYRLGCFSHALGAGILTLATLGIIVAMRENRLDTAGIYLTAAAVCFAGLAISEAIRQRP